MKGRRPAPGIKPADIVEPSGTRVGTKTVNGARRAASWMVTGSAVRQALGVAL